MNIVLQLNKARMIGLRWFQYLEEQAYLLFVVMPGMVPASVRTIETPNT